MADGGSSWAHRTSWQSVPIGRKALVVIAIPVLPLILTAALYFRSAATYEAARADADRAAANRLRQSEVFSLATEAESSVRGYLLGGNRVYLEQHARVAADLDRTLAELEANTSDPKQQAHLPRLRELVTARLEALDAALKSRDTSGLNSPEMLRHVARGTEVMRALRAQVLEMEALQAQIMSGRTQRARDAAARSDAIVLSGAAAGVLGGVAAALLFTTGVTRRIDLTTRNMLRLGRGEPLLPVPPAADEIGTLAAGTERAAQLIAERDTLLQQRMTELEHLTRELEAFSYSVSHDLRAPLRHIAGFATMLQKSASEQLTDQQRRYIRTIVEAAARMGRLIDDLLAFSRTSRTELRRSRVDLAAIVRDVRQQLAADVNGRTVDWVVHPLPQVEGDAAMLRVVFDNLLSNALKYTRPRDRAEIEVGSRDGDRGEAVIYVRDNGVGFDMQYQNKLFGVFQRLHSSDDFEGTGIGLATVRRIVSRHGGRAWAESEPGRGATFYVSLPTTEHAA